MKNYLITLGIFTLLIFTSCQQEDLSIPNESITDSEVAQIKALGFSSDNVIKEKDGYIVEGDIFLSKEDLTSKHKEQFLRVGEEEQYHTTYLVSAPRTITVSMTGLPTSYVTALDVALSRYNALGLQLQFSRVPSGANIAFTPAPSGAGYLASAGFPKSDGSPHNSIRVNANAIGNGSTSTFTNYVATILAHEIGHCIGFRHTDYMSRSYSCGLAFPNNEAIYGVGAIHIPGTPLGPDAASWMLACIGRNVNRPFNANDVIALNYLYK